MPDLRELLHDAAPAAEPHFDAADVRARVDAAERRHRRTAVAAMAAVVLLVVVGIGITTTVTSDRTGLVDTVPPGEWPQTVTFAGAEVEVVVGAQPRDLVGYVEPGDTTTQVGASTDADGRVSLWFTCGGDEVVRVRELYDPSTAPALPVAALAEALTQLATANSCTPEPPAGTPDVVFDGGLGLAGLARAIDEAGMTACCATVALVPMADRPGVSGSGIATFRAAEGSVAWAVEDGRDAPLQFTADFRSWVPTDLAAPQTLPLAGGHVAVDREADLVANTCGMATLQARLPAAELPRWEAFLEGIRCTPSPPEGLAPTFDLMALLTDLGVEPVATPSADATVAAAQVVVDGEVLVVRSGGMGQVGLPRSAMDGELPTGASGFTGVGEAWPAESSYAPIGGAFTVCTITHVVFAASEPGLDRAMALAERIGAHPSCATVGLPEGAPPMPTAEPTAEPTAVAGPVIAALEDAGLPVSEITRNGPVTDFHFQPRPVAGVPQPSPVWVSLAGPDAPPPVVTADTRIVELADGEGVVLPGAGLVSFTCGEVGLVTTTGPGAGGSELEWIEQLPDALGCQPRPHGLSRESTSDDGTVIQRFESIREARLHEAVGALGIEQCCGEPSHGGAGAATGMVWEGVAVGITAGPPAFDDPHVLPGPNVVELRDGRADAPTEGNPQVRFDCDDTHYALEALDGAVADHSLVLRAAEALVGQLRCTPTVGP